MDKNDIAKVLEEMATVFEIKGENPFKIRAYENAARIVEGLDDLEDRIKFQTLTEIKGIGKNLSDHIIELYRTSKIAEYEKIRKTIPSGLFDLLGIPGLGPKRVKFLYEKLGVDDLGELELACRNKGLRKLQGFGEKMEEKILQGIAYQKRHIGQHLFSHALIAALDIYDQISKSPLVDRAEIAGSLRRKREVIKDIDIVAATSKPEQLMKFFTSLAQVERVDAKGETKSAVILKSGISCDLRAVTQKEFPYALHHFTGSKEHNVTMRGRAIKLGMKMNEYGLFKTGGKKEKLVPCKTEEDIFKALGLSYIPPELRENMGEIEAAEKNKIPTLIEEDDLKGILHVHSNYSDGIATIEEMTLFAKKMGYSYVGICDHSQSAFYAGGLKEDALKRQWKEIEALNKKLKGIKILKGIESDILPDGSLDYPDNILKGFDFVIASIHSKFNMTEEEMTKRILTALQNRYVRVLGHPTGRLLLSREAYKVDIHKVIDMAAERDVAIEINSNPHRLDLDWRLGQYARSKGCKIAICPDAHATENMLDIMFGVGIARKGWMTKEDVINTWDVDRLMKWIKN